MRHSISVVAGLVCIAVLGGSAFSSGPSKSHALVAPPSLRPDADFGNIPLYFIPNRGQADNRALFSARAAGFTLWATRDGLIFDQAGSPEVTGPDQRKHGGAVTSLVFLGSRPGVEVSAEGETTHRANFFLGQDPARWRTDIPTAAAIRYHSLYPGIDLKVYGVGRHVEYDWVIAPGANPAAIRFRYDRARGTRLDAEGNLIVDSAAGELTHQKPAAYQDIDGRRVAVACRYDRLGAETYGFRIGRYDRRRPLVIDPLVIVWSSYLGGDHDDEVMALAVDAEGGVLVAGNTESADFPLVNPRYPALAGGIDVFVAGITPAGDALLFSTFIGGRGDDYVYDLAVDAAGSPIVCGKASRNFPVRNAYDLTYNGGSADGFLVKLTSSGDAILFSTYLGGQEHDSLRRIILDPAGAILAVGSTDSTNFPAVKGFDKTFNGWTDVFSAKFTADGKTLLFSTFLGGKDWETARGIALDAEGRIYIAGGTESPNFPVKSALYPAHISGEDGFLTILTPTGKALVASTYIGGRMDETLYGLAVDATGSIYLGGETKSPDFPTRAAYDPIYNGDYDGVILKLKPLAAGLVFSTYFGGSNHDSIGALAVDAAGGIVVAGTTDSPKFPIKNAYNSTLSGPSDAFVAKFLPSGRALAFSTYLGGSKSEDAKGVYLDWAGDIYVYGATDSKNFPRKSAFDAVYGGRSDGFVTKFRWR
jgi:hypothetical protein